MPRIFPGRGRKRHMPYYYARWRGVPCNGKMLIVYAGLMPKNMCQINKIGVEMTIENHGSAKIFRPTPVLFKGTMQPMENFISTFVLSAWPTENSLTIQKTIVPTKTKQKTSIKVENVKNSASQVAELIAKRVPCKNKTCMADVTLSNDSGKLYQTRFIYSSTVNPRQIDARKLRSHTSNDMSKDIVQSRTVWCKNSAINVRKGCEGNQMSLGHIDMQCDSNVKCQNVKDRIDLTSDNCTNAFKQSIVGKDMPVNNNQMVEVSKSPNCGTNTRTNDSKRHTYDSLAAKVISAEDKGLSPEHESHSFNHDRGSVNKANATELNFTPIFDINYSGIEDNFANSILHAHQFVKNSIGNVNTCTHKKWREQSQFDFVPIDDQKMPNTNIVNQCADISPFELHDQIRDSGVPNYIGGQNTRQITIEHKCLERRFDPVLGSAVTTTVRIRVSVRL